MGGRARLRVSQLAEGGRERGRERASGLKLEFIGEAKTVTERQKKHGTATATAATATRH